MTNQKVKDYLKKQYPKFQGFIEYTMVAEMALNLAKEYHTEQLNLRKVNISATEKAQLISSLSQLLIDNSSAGLYTQLQTDCVNKLELLVNSIEL